MTEKGMLLHGKYKWMFLMLLFCVLITGCGKQFDVSAIDEVMEIETTEDALMTPTDDNLIVVGVSQIGSESVWRSANTTSIQRVFTKENGYFLIFDNARQKQEDQIKAIRGFISQRVDYIVFSPLMEDGWETVLQEAKDAGIPVILMDRKVNVSDTSLYTSWVGSNFTEEGKKAGEWLENYLKEKGWEEERMNIVVLTGTEGSTPMVGRTAGFDYIAEQHENWRVLEKVNAEFTTTKGKEEMKKLLRKYADIDVVISQNDDMTFGAIEAIYDVGKTTGEHGDIIMISFDAVKEALEQVKRGRINVDVECNPEQGTYIERIIRKLEGGEDVERAYYVPEKIFTKDNVDEYLEDRTY